MFYRTYNESGQGPTLESTTYYYGNDLGNVSRVVTDKENTGTGERQSEPTWLVYAKKWMSGLLCAGRFAT